MNKEETAEYMRIWRKTQLESDPTFRERSNEASKLRKKKYRSSAKNKAKEAAYQRERTSRPEVRKKLNDAAFAKRNGITRKEADEMTEAQGGKCRACGCPPAGKRHRSKLHLDHCHETGKVRGMLCSNCNIALGHVKDSPRTLEKLAAYLRSSK